MELNKPGQIEILLTKLNKRDRDKFPIYKMNFITNIEDSIKNKNYHYNLDNPSEQVHRFKQNLMRATGNINLIR